MQTENKQKQFLFNTKSKNLKKLDFERFLERLIRMKKALEKTVRCDNKYKDKQTQIFVERKLFKDKEIV